MSRSEIALIALLVALAAGLAGLVYGMQLGAATEVARQDKQAVKALSALIDSHKTLIGEAATASKNMRAALSLRATQDAQTNKDFKNALAATADNRAGCVFPAGVMRQLAAASERAGRAAAGGIHHRCPAPAPAPGGPEVDAVAVALKDMYDLYGICAGRMVDLLDYLDGGQQ